MTCFINIIKSQNQKEYHLNNLEGLILNPQEKYQQREFSCELKPDLMKYSTTRTIGDMMPRVIYHHIALTNVEKYKNLKSHVTF